MLSDGRENMGNNRSLAQRLKVALFAGTALPVLLLGMAAPAIAQDRGNPDQKGPASSSERVPDIVVTASKREQTLQDTPIAVSVVEAQEIERAEIQDLLDLQTLVPSLAIRQGQTSGNTNFFIRGFGNGQNAIGLEPSVGVFIDGVYRIDRTRIRSLPLSAAVASRKRDLLSLALSRRIWYPMACINAKY